MSESAEDLRKRLDESLRQGCPKKPKPKAAPAEVVELIPPRKRIVRRGWQAYPPTHTSYQPYQPSRSDEIKELQLRNAAAARRERVRRDQDGLGLWGGPETIEDLVREQDERWRR